MERIYVLKQKDNGKKNILGFASSFNKAISLKEKFLISNDIVKNNLFIETYPIDILLSENLFD